MILFTAAEELSSQSYSLDARCCPGYSEGRCGKQVVVLTRCRRAGTWRVLNLQAPGLEIFAHLRTALATPTPGHHSEHSPARRVKFHVSNSRPDAWQMDNAKCGHGRDVDCRFNSSERSDARCLTQATTSRDARWPVPAPDQPSCTYTTRTCQYCLKRHNIFPVESFS